MADPEYLTVEHLDRRTLSRIFSKIQINKTTGCWEWTAALIHGYGVVWFNGRNELVHRLFWAWLVRPLPRGLGAGIPQLDHIACDNPRCSNPVHLRETDQIGNLDRTNAVSSTNRRKTHCKNGHRLPTQPNRWNGYGRTCVTCANDRQREAKRLRVAAERASRPPKPVVTAEERAQKRRAQTREWHARNKDRVRENHRLWRAKRRHQAAASRS